MPPSQPLKVVDPDHPLAVLVRKAQADNNLAAAQSTEGTAVQPSQVEYPSDRKYIAIIGSSIHKAILLMVAGEMVVKVAK